MMQWMVALMHLVSISEWSASARQPADTGDAGQVRVLKVFGMACGDCAARVEATAKKIEGVKRAKASQPRGTAEITYDLATTPDAIAKTITDKTGFMEAVTPSEDR